MFPFCVYIVLYLRLDWFCRFILNIALQTNEKRFKMCIYLCKSLVVLGWSFAVDGWRSNCSRRSNTVTSWCTQDFIQFVVKAHSMMKSLPCPVFPRSYHGHPMRLLKKNKNARSSRSTFSLTRRRYLHENCHAWLKHIRDSRGWYDGERCFKRRVAATRSRFWKRCHSDSSDIRLLQVAFYFPLRLFPPSIQDLDSANRLVS